jgi:hypothetical protein
MEAFKELNNEEEIRKTLDNLLENAKSVKDINQIETLIDNYIEDGYNVRDYINKCNLIVQKFNKKG